MKSGRCGNTARVMARETQRDASGRKKRQIGHRTVLFIYALFCGRRRSTVLAFYRGLETLSEIHTSTVFCIVLHAEILQKILYSNFMWQNQNVLGNNMIQTRLVITDVDTSRQGKNIFFRHKFDWYYASLIYWDWTIFFSGGVKNTRTLIRRMYFNFNEDYVEKIRIRYPPK